MKDSTKLSRRPLNVYNVFFALERQRLIQEKGSCGPAAVHQQKCLSYYDLAGYDPISLPDLPPRFQNVKMQDGWYLPVEKDSKRKHVKSHGSEYKC